MMSLVAETRFLFVSIVKHGRLLLEMARRDVSDRYAGQVLGTWWAILHPVTTLAVFMFIFGVVFRIKADPGLDIPGDHTLYIISGLVPWLVATDVLSRSSSIVASQAPLVKQVVFPVEILPVKMVLASVPTFLIGFAGLTLYALAVGRTSPGLLLYPLAAVPFYLFLLGVAFLLAALGVFLRDMKDMVQIFTLIGLYVAPIFYFMDWVPERLRPFIYLNPVTAFVENFHDAAYYGVIQSRFMWFVAAVLGCVATWCGAMVFARLKPHFGSYL